MNIKIGDKDFTLKYNNKALFKIEKELDTSVISLFTKNIKELEKIHTIFVIVHAGIQEEISFDEFSDLTTFEELGKLLPKISELVAEGFDTGSKKK